MNETDPFSIGQEITTATPSTTDSPAATAFEISTDFPTVHAVPSWLPTPAVESAAGGTFDSESVDFLVSDAESMPDPLLHPRPADTLPRQNGRWAPEGQQREGLSHMLDGMSDYGS